MSWFNKTKTNYVGEMREYVKNFMLQYIKEFPSASDVVIPIFSNVEELIRGRSEKEISKAMKENRVNMEHCTLNIIQNFAMIELKPQSAISFIQNSNYVYDLYNYVNELKYKKGYISEQQFDENEMLATHLSLQSPISGWF